ncbi:MAG: hypothetical protein MI924_16370 [Chloroflexales bacterium]|nr:hypothetical protein [Chloroflexales bacterium]
MEAYLRQQFDFLLITATERFVERIVQHSGGPEAALARLRLDPQGEGIWLDEFVRARFQDFLLDNVVGACFVLQALAWRQVDPPPPGRSHTLATCSAHIRRSAGAQS